MGIESPATEIPSSKWAGLSGIATVGCYEGDDGYAGLCENPRAMLNNHAGTSAIINGNPQSEDQFETILRSFEFLR
jgi:hypothetical protein